ncbi:Protocadherin Fat 1 [Eumeta japonica]|uniref:Protocadherin Fat 1 n=1 Tax=Eumeta variegata TaxID=151549 RepID=A0A4C1TZR7_EUMVA|nr:Protocadherin Fat 1 [Eumeta japonica]
MSAPVDAPPQPEAGPLRSSRPSTSSGARGPVRGLDRHLSDNLDLVCVSKNHFDFGNGVYENGVWSSSAGGVTSAPLLEVQLGARGAPVRPFRDAAILTDGLFISESEVLSVRIKTDANVTGKGFFAHYKTVSHFNISRVVELRDARAGRLTPLNWPAAAPSNGKIRTRLVAPHNHILSVAFAQTTLVLNDEDLWPCGEKKGWTEVVDSYTDNNGTRWILCEIGRHRRKIESATPLLINSYLHSLIITQVAGDQGVGLNVSVLVSEDSNYHSKILMLPEETSLESCYPNPCLHGGFCASDDAKHFCQCPGYYTGIFCLLTACDRSPCAFGNCTLSPSRADGEGFECACAAGWRGRRCNERIRPCAARPCNNRGACSERDGTFMCQCNPSWKGKSRGVVSDSLSDMQHIRRRRRAFEDEAVRLCEIPNPTPNITSLGTRMMQEPFWLGLFAVFSVLGVIGLVWCAKRHFPEKIEKLLAEEADRCARREYGLLEHSP